MSAYSLYLLVAVFVPCVVFLYSLVRITQHLLRYLSLDTYLDSILQHVTVSMTLLPIATIGGLIVATGYHSAVEFLQSTVLPSLDPNSKAFVVLAGVKAVPGDLNLTDVLAAALLLLVAYGSTIVLHHLVDIVRLLKLSRRRLIQPELREERRLQAQETTRNQGRKLQESEERRKGYLT